MDEMSSCAASTKPVGMGIVDFRVPFPLAHVAYSLGLSVLNTIE